MDTRQVSWPLPNRFGRWFDFHIFYIVDTVHLPEILACPGFRAGRRYRTGGSAAGRLYLALYEIDGPLALDSAEFKARRGWGPFAGKVKFDTTVFAQLPPAKV